MARQAEAEREKRAKLIHAEGELAAAERLAAAAEIISAEEGGLQLRYLQTLGQIANDRQATIVFPLPIDITRGLIPHLDENGSTNGGGGRRSGGPAGTASGTGNRDGGGAPAPAFPTERPTPRPTEAPDVGQRD